MTTLRCQRIDAHDAHEWPTQPLGAEWPRAIYTCPGHVTVEGGHWTRCPGCGTRGPSHDIGGEECRESAREKAISQGDR